jgi:hypothetical protein
MFQAQYEDAARFASEGQLALELQRAKAEYINRTGELFESDLSFERRIAAFLEWYVLDRKTSMAPDYTPLELYLGKVSATCPAADRETLSGLTRSRLSLYAFRRSNGDSLRLVDILSDEDYIVSASAPAGLAAGDILEARVVPYDGRLLITDIYYCHPRTARRVILKAAKRFRQEGGGRDARIALVHRIAYFANRCERYKHVNPKSIFAELIATAA